MFSSIKGIFPSVLVFVLLSGCSSEQGDPVDNEIIASSEDVFTPAQKELLEQLDQIIIDEIKFDRASFGDVINFLVQASRETHEPQDSVKHSANIVYFDDPTNIGPSDGDIFGGGFGEGSSPKSDPSEAYPPISLTLRNVSLAQALDRVCEEAGLMWTVDRNGLIDVQEE